MTVKFLTWSLAYQYGMGEIDRVADITVRLRVRHWFKRAMFKWRDEGEVMPIENEVIRLVKAMVRSIAHREGVKI